ncbi:MAG: fibrillarin-like rRNA/tRNA 2'-O-methyltransferase [Candidatus Micrarchaeaceae archaeon]
MTEKIKKVTAGVFLIDGKLATRNAVKGSRVYNEKLVDKAGVEYRLWNPYRSKLAAAILKGLKNFAIKEDSTVLYLGAATGTTVSHVSDIAKSGAVYAIEFSERSMRELLKVCEKRKNILPILEDARYPERYAKHIARESCDVLYQDVSAKEQAEILLKNADFLKRGGTAYFIIKSQSIDVSKDPAKVYERALNEASKKFDVVDTIQLEPYDTLHLFAVLKKRQ